MGKNRWLLIALAILVAMPIAWYLLSPAFIVLEMNETSPYIAPETLVTGGNETVSMPRITAQGDFKPGNHDVSGRALLIEEAEGNKTLRFEDFETINGPDLFIYLSKDATNDDFINIGEIKATKGNVNYDISPSIDTSQYKYVLVWCRAFRVLFSYAELA